ncbi:ATPase SWSAP1 [Brachyhypopomus gauderio]|uniref:ATPase SWSAP1 n=1 Tax=Brachyhypopomus gauderio TaxID=698409 RepID=UPI0040428D65
MALIWSPEPFESRLAAVAEHTAAILISAVSGVTLVVGDQNITRALLLLTAVAAASELGSRAMFFTHSPIQSLPFSLQGSSGLSLKPESLKKVRFVYPKSLEELLEDVASLHELVPQAVAIPSLVIVDGLEQYVCGPEMQGRPQREAQSAAAHVMALLHDTAAFLTQNLEARVEAQAPCRVIVSIQPNREGRNGGDVLDPDAFLSVLERYLQVTCTLERERKGEGQNEWLLHLSGEGLQGDGEKNGPALKWRVALQPSGVLEMWPDSSTKEETLHRQSSVEVKDN